MQLRPETPRVVVDEQIEGVRPAKPFLIDRCRQLGEQIEQSSGGYAVVGVA